ncbi:hypothetical protein LW135_06175 [Helicobacter sp. faydin-H20]|uniref:hypothetical protein n=1 Tax=Helicobacter anatolicus TaxID=2905874 RepID=UPI001E2D653B|nr:hypothetical protein [Helicobacter anatolicus]MCE3037413.1 hypothetical protein [Helicobacter anatolicus]
MKTNKKFKLFTPIVASSLALVLGGNVYAAANCMDSNTGTPLLCAGTKDMEMKKDNILVWNAGQSSMSTTAILYFITK